jgi:endonuclease YncB( thermonuclease family)
MMRGHWFGVLLAVLSVNAIAQDYSGQVVWVGDGDTIGVLKDGVMQKIRLSAIDAPEKKQAFGPISKKGMASICAKRVAIVHPIDTDKYGRTVADVTCDGINAGQWMVANGLAWVYDQYAANHAAYYDAQHNARRQRLGLWGDDNPMPPWEWRRANPNHDAGAHPSSRNKYSSTYAQTYTQFWHPPRQRKSRTNFRFRF